MTWRSRVCNCALQTPSPEGMKRSGDAELTAFEGPSKRPRSLFIARDPAVEFVLSRGEGAVVTVMISGYRFWTDEAAIERELRKLPADRVRIIHGDCRTGADMMADAIARRLGMKVEKFPPDWKTHGRSAGMRRNADMIKLADCLIAFPGAESRGTVDAIKKARQEGKPVTVISEVTTSNSRL